MLTEIWLNVSVSILCTLADQRKSGSSDMISVNRIPYIYTTCNMEKKKQCSIIPEFATLSMTSEQN